MVEKYIQNLSLPLNSIDILFGLSLFLLILVFLSFLSKRNCLKKIAKIPGMNINEDIQRKINDLRMTFSESYEEIQKNKKNIEYLKNKALTIHKIKIIKYNPYKDMGVGGLQSFSTSFLDENGNGIILTNLYSRERSRVILKEIQNYKSEQELTPEEKEVLG